MTSRASAITATAVTLGLVLILSISSSIYLYLTLLRHQKSHKRDSLEAGRQLQAQRQKTESLSKVFDKYTSVYPADLTRSFQETYRNPSQAPLRAYLIKWIKYDRAQVSIFLETSRIEKTLFPKPPVDTTGDSDTIFAPFPNPKHYTSTEIAELLKTQDGAFSIIKHIMVSILLTNTSIDGNRFRTLLPLEPWGISSLRNLSTATRNGLHLQSGFRKHICMFGLCQAKNFEPERLERQRKLYHAFFETLLEPFFESNSAVDVAARKVDMDEVISASVAHGMKVLAFTQEVEYKWGEKEQNLAGDIQTTPAMWSINFEFGEYFSSEELVRATCL